MKEETTPTQTDPLHSPTTQAPRSNAEDLWEANQHLAEGLDRVRGLAVQRAKAAHARLRWQACLATALGIALGALLGSSHSRRRTPSIRTP